LQWRQLWWLKQYCPAGFGNHHRKLSSEDNCNQWHGHYINDDPAIDTVGLIQPARVANIMKWADQISKMFVLATSRAIRMVWRIGSGVVHVGWRARLPDSA